MKKRLTALVVAAAMMSGGCSYAEQTAPPLTIPKQITVCTSHRAEIYEPLIKEFQERTGIWVRVETAGTSQLLESISQGECKADVVFGGGVDTLAAYSEWFEPYYSPELKNISQDFCPTDGSYTPFATLPLVFFYNTKQLPYGTAPNSWEQLLGEEWHGKVAFADPNASGSCYTAIATAILAMPQYQPDEVIDAFCAVAGANLFSGSGEIYAAVADGSMLVGVTLEESAIKQTQVRSDVAFLYPRDGSSAIPDGTAIVKGCSNLDAARQFVDFTICADAQRLLRGLYRRPVRPDIEPSSELLPLNRITLVDYDLDWSAENRELILERWNNTLGVIKEGG